MPGAIERYLNTFSPLVRYAEQECLSVDSQFWGVSRWVILGCLIYGAFLSGPALLLSWIGGLLTRRCVATLPRRRFRAMTCLVSLGFAGVALAIAVTPQPFVHEQDVDLDFRIVDKDSGQPIRAAFLRITDPFNPTSLPPVAFTGADGCAELTGCFRASGQRNAFRTMGDFSPWGRWLEVWAPDYQTVRIPLPEVLGPHTDLERPCLQKVGLTPGRTPEDSLNDIAGIYDYGDTVIGVWSFEILRDGRFTYFAKSCSSPYFQEYGYLKRHDGEIQLISIRGLRATQPLTLSLNEIATSGRRRENDVREGSGLCSRRSNSS